MKIPSLLMTLLFLALQTLQGQQAVPTEKDFAAYLLVYFTDETHSLYFALSRDGYSFTDVNNGKPIMNGRDLAEQKGIRDVHIMRGPDGAFYLSMTDLHIYAQREGLRTDLWERPANLYDWGNNRAIILMKSSDLINWTHSDFRLDKAFPELKDIGCAWAPETIWDAEKGKLMVYFTMRIGRGKNSLYYSYANKEFTKLETKPEPLFDHPGAIDGDITKVGDKYHLFYAFHGIKQAVSDKINRDYVFDPAKVDSERVACEAPNVWKRIGTDTYVLMLDVYGAKPHTMGFYETTDFVNFKNLGLFNQGVMKSTNFPMPKHGAVIPLPLKEAQALAAHWKMAF
jgi:hypothetical protein